MGDRLWRPWSGRLRGRLLCDEIESDVKDEEDDGESRKYANSFWGHHFEIIIL